MAPTAARDLYRAGLDPDPSAATVAARQWGVIATRQLAGCGLNRTQISRRVKAGRLRPTPYRGVYAWGHARLCPEGFLMAAVLACGEGAVASHTRRRPTWTCCRTRGETMT